jgi:hypothetical protein
MFSHDFSYATKAEAVAAALEHRNQSSEIEIKSQRTISKWEGALLLTYNTEQAGESEIRH